MQSSNVFSALIVTLFLNRTFNLEQLLATCSQRVKNVYPKNAYQTQKLLFDKLDSLGIEYTNERTNLKNSTMLDFESICVLEGSFKKTTTTKWIGWHIPTLASISSNHVRGIIFLCYSDTHYLVTSFIGSLEYLALRSKANLKISFCDIDKD